MIENDTCELDVLRVRRNPWVVAASCIPWAAIPVLLALSAITGRPFVAGIPHFGLIGAFIFLATWRRMPYARFLKSKIRVDAESLRLGNEVIARRDITKVELVPTIGAAKIRIESRGRMVADLLEMRDDAEAHELLGALGFDASRRTASYRLGSLAMVRYAYAPLLIVPFAFAMMTLEKYVSFAPVLLPVLVVLMAVGFLKRSSLTVGADGLLLRWLWIREFIATKDIVGTARFESGFGKNRVRGVEVMTKQGRSVRLPVMSSFGDDEIATVEQRIRDVMDLDKGAAHADDEALILARGDLALHDWIVRLKAIGLGATATLRTAAVLPEQLWRVASDAAQPPMARAAAAVALAPTLDESGRVRLADLAKSTAAPKLRVALEHAAEDADEETLEKALGEMED